MRKMLKTRHRIYGEGRIIRKPGSIRLYAVFQHFGRRVEYATRLEDSPDNRLVVQRMLDDWLKRIKEKTFRFIKDCPLAPQKQKILFSELEKKHWGNITNDALTKPEEVNFGDYAKEWIKNELPALGPDLERAYKSGLEHSIIPFVGAHSFFSLTSAVVRKYFAEATVQCGRTKGQKLSTKTQSNYRTFFERVWSDANEQYRWNLPSPFPHRRRQRKNTEARMSLKDAFYNNKPITPP